MPREIELKLALPEEQQQRFRNLPYLNQAVSCQSGFLLNRYYDTPRLDLQRHGVALRCREQAGQWIQTVKCAGNTSGGLSSRPEWETEFKGEFDFSLIEDTAVRALLELPEIRNALSILFETRFQRTTWRFESLPDCALLLMLDEGEIRSADRRSPISEIEIELALKHEPLVTSRHLDALFSLAQSLGSQLPLLPNAQSKAERGYRLFHDMKIEPRKARAVDLKGCSSPLHAFQRVAQECLDHLQSNHEAALCNDHPEFIHQMRIATRRLRSAQRFFSPWLPLPALEVRENSLRHLAGQLGNVRNLDVLMEDILAPAMNKLPPTPALKALNQHIRQQAHLARLQARKHLQSVQHAQFMLHMTRLLHQDIQTWKPEGAETVAGAEESLATLLRPALKRGLKKLRRLARSVCLDDPASLHRLRIAVKRLRHAMEFSASCLDESGNKQRYRRLLQQLTTLQDDLGILNDLSHAGPPLLQYAQNRPTRLEAVASVGQHHLALYHTLLEGLPKKLRQIKRMRCPKIAPKNGAGRKS